MKSDTYAIRTFDLTRNYGKRRAVSSINICIEKGELFSLLGKNGAGKTTTIKMLSCLLPPTSGYAAIMGFDIRKNPLEIKKITGVSPQETAIAGHLSTRENLILFGGLYGLSNEISGKRAFHLMELMELEDRKDQARLLSGGMKRRLSIAMALMPDPRILFLDEPTLGLDPHSRRSVWNYINKLKGDKTILLTTHYLEEADSLADHVAVIENSEIIASGTPSELKSRYCPMQTIRISTDYIPEAVIENLRNRGLKLDISPSFSALYNITISAEKIDFYSVISLFQDHNIFIKNIRMHSPTLEEVFLEITGKEVDNEAH